MKRLLAILILLTFAPAFAAEEPSILNPSGQPIPRFVSLKFDAANVRVGPGKRYPIKYVYKRIHLPVQVVEEFAHWRKITDFEGSSGWVHKGAIDGRRSVVIIGKTQDLYDDPAPTAAIVMHAQAHVIGDLKRCEPNWCQLIIKGRKGWIRKSDIWGVGREEVFKG